MLMARCRTEAARPADRPPPEFGRRDYGRGLLSFGGSQARYGHPQGRRGACGRRLLDGIARSPERPVADHLGRDAEVGPRGSLPSELAHVQHGRGLPTRRTGAIALPFPDLAKLGSSAAFHGVHAATMENIYLVFLALVPNQVVDGMRAPVVRLARAIRRAGTPGTVVVDDEQASHVVVDHLGSCGHGHMRHKGGAFRACGRKIPFGSAGSCQMR
jgi:hypothetical protein